MSFRIEVINIKNPSPELAKYSACRSYFTIPITLIPNIESPFKNLGMKHDVGGLK